MKIGWSMKNITPTQPVALAGQFHERIANEARDPLMATAIALEGAGEKGAQAVLVSCDLIAIEKHVQEGVRERVREMIPELDPNAVILSATHTHTAPITYSSSEWIPPLGTRARAEIMSPADYSDLAIGQIAEAVAEAWRGRSPGTVSRAEAEAVLGYNRRVLYDDGTAAMYGQVDNVHFQRFGGPEDHRVEMLFAWDSNHEVTGIIVNVACTAQINENDTRISADYFGEVRDLIKQKWNRDVFVLGMIGAAGDLSPYDLIRAKHPLRRTKDEQLRHAARKLVHAMEEALETAEYPGQAEPVFKHIARRIELPLRMVAKADAEFALREWEKYREESERQDDPVAYFHSLGFTRQSDIFQYWTVQNRYKQLRQHLFYSFDLHALRIGDVALVTNPFELFTEYGLRIKARSAAKQTFIAQLTCDSAGYLPTAEAIAEGGYSTQLFSGLVGPDGGQLLVEHSLETIRSLWEDDPGK